MPLLRSRDVHLKYERTGHGPDVLLIQGVGIVGEGWRPQIDGLQNRFTFTTFDNRGIGGSTRGSGPLTIDAMAADALAILDAEGIDRAHVAGHSMGGVIAQALALTVPDRIKSLSFLCTFARGVQATMLGPSAMWIGLRTRVGTAAMRRNAFLEMVMPPAVLAGIDRPAYARDLASLFGHDLAEQPPIVMKQLRALRGYDALDRLSALASKPTIVVSAHDDRIARPAFGRMLASAIPGARFVEIANAGHGVTIHRPEEINGLLAAHWRRNG